MGERGLSQAHNPEDLVTFRDPETSRLANQLPSEGFPQTATGSFRLHVRSGGQARLSKPNKMTTKRSSFYLVRERGLEPPRPEGHQPLKLTRLPIPPFAHTPIVNLLRVRRVSDLPKKPPFAHKMINLDNYSEVTGFCKPARSQHSSTEHYCSGLVARLV